MEAPILRIAGLRAVFRIAGRDIAAVQDIDLEIGSGETVALVGESGSGKSVTSLSIIGLLPKKIGHIADGQISIRRRDGSVTELTGLDAESLRRVRGNDIGMVFQEPMTSLNPVYTIGEQIAEPIRIHLGKSHREAAAEAVRLLAQVGIPDPARRAKQYPHELSGGMRQRATIAMALVLRSDLADRRRTDDRARRDDPGADPRPAGRPSGASAAWASSSSPTISAWLRRSPTAWR